MNSMDSALVLIRNIFPQAGEATEIMASLSDDVVEICMIGAALDSASRNLRLALMRQHTTERKPLGRRIVLASDPDFKLVLERESR